MKTNLQRTKCEVFTRVVGYIRPVQQWNDGKVAEFKQRKVHLNRKCPVCNSTKVAVSGTQFYCRKCGFINKEIVIPIRTK